MNDNNFRIGDAVIYIKNKNMTGVVMQVDAHKVLMAYRVDKLSRTPNLVWVNQNEIFKIPIT